MARTGESYSAARAQLARRARTTVAGNPAVIVAITDMPRATAFYNRALGLSIRWSSPAWTILGDDGETIALEPGGAVGADTGIGLKVDDLDTVLGAVVEAGGRVESQHGALAHVTDPDGNRLRLMGTGNGSVA